MRVYEIVLVLQPSLKDAERSNLVKKIKEWLQGFTFSKEDEWGQKALAYQIKKQVAGFFLDWEGETEGSIPVDFEKRLMTNENVLRHLVIRKK